MVCYIFTIKNDILNPITLSHSAQITTAVWSETENLCTEDLKEKISVTTIKGNFYSKIHN